MTDGGASPMKRIACVLLILVLFILPALADPLPLLEDYAVDISEPYDENDPSAGTFVFSCRYPHADETAEGAAGINAFYEYDLDDTVLNMVPMLQDAFEGTDYSMTTTYEGTCNNDDYFSVLIRTEKKWADHLRTGWKGQVFSRKQGMGATCTLPTLLGILAPDENEEWIQDYKNKEAETLVRKMVWEMIEDYDGEYDLSELTEEYLEALFFPAEDFYLDENGDPVFYLQPEDVLPELPENVQLITFPISLEDLLDEL